MGTPRTDGHGLAGVRRHIISISIANSESTRRAHSFVITSKPKMTLSLYRTT